jgi:hypothetical protein
VPVASTARRYHVPCLLISAKSGVRHEKLRETQR